jgi:hypothetical protein
MIIQLQTKSSYIPKWHGNRSLPQADQIVVHYQKVPLKDKARLLPPPSLNFRYDPSGKVVGGDTKIESDTRILIPAMLIRIDNLEYELEDGKHSIVTAKDLLAAPVEFEDLVDELGNFFKDELEKKIDEKN